MAIDSRLRTDQKHDIALKRNIFVYYIMQSLYTDNEAS